MTRYENNASKFCFYIDTSHLKRIRPREDNRAVNIYFERTKWVFTALIYIRIAWHAIAVNQHYSMVIELDR